MRCLLTSVKQALMITVKYHQRCLTQRGSGLVEKVCHICHVSREDNFSVIKIENFLISA